MGPSALSFSNASNQAPHRSFLQTNFSNPCLIVEFFARNLTVAERFEAFCAFEFVPLRQSIGRAHALWLAAPSRSG